MAETIEALRSAWRSAARYTVYRTQIGVPKAALADGLTYDEAKAAVVTAESAIRLEPDYRPNVMGRAMAVMQLENPEAAQQKFRSLMGSQE